MSNFSHTYNPVRLRLRVNRVLVLVGAAIAIGLTMLVIALASGGTDAATSPVNQSSGVPNEALRGQAAASSSGAEPTQAGGPNESARGAAASSAAGR